jgi:hypothetical protein
MVFSLGRCLLDFTYGAGFSGSTIKKIKNTIDPDKSG